MRVTFFFFLLFLVFPAGAKDLPARPSRFIVDPTRMLSEERKENLTLVLERHARDHGTEVFLVIGSIPAGLSADQYAKKLGPVWSDRNKGWAVIVYRPGMIGAPGLASGGSHLELFNKEIWEKQVAFIRNLSVQHWEPAENLDFVARRMAEMISFSHRLPRIVANFKMEKRGEQKRDFSANLERLKILAIVGSGAVCFLVAFVILAIRHIRRRTRTWLFPECAYRPRLGGTHSGGSDICRAFTAPRS